MRLFIVGVVSYLVWHFDLPFPGLGGVLFMLITGGVIAVVQDVMELSR